MGDISPYLLIFGNCCAFPLLCFGLGIWWAKGMPGSPFVIRRRGRDDFGFDD